MTGPQLPSGGHRSEEHADWDALAVGWALSALDPEDEARFADHLPGCARCATTVRESLYTVVDLAYATPDEPPPPALRSRLMAAVAAEPRRAVHAEPGEWPLGAPAEERTDWFADRADAPPTDLGDARTPGAPDAGPFQLPEPGPDHSLPADLGRPSGPPGHRQLGAPDLGDRRSELGGRRPEPDLRAGRPEGTAWPRITELGDRRTEAAGRGRHAAPDDPGPNVVPLEPRRRRRFTVTAAAAAAVALIAGLAVWNVQLRSDRDDLQQIVAQRETAIAQLTANGPATVAALTSNGKPNPTRQATLVIRGTQVEVIVETLGATTGDVRYWLWTLDCDGAPKDLKPIRGFTVTQPEFSVRDVGSDPGVASATCFAISQETGPATPVKPATVVAIGKPTQ